MPTQHFFSHRFDTGVLIPDGGERIQIRLTKSGGAVYSRFPEHFDPIAGTKLFVSWRGGDLPRCMHGRRWVHRSAIEPVSFWNRRSSSYKRFYPLEPNALGLRAEKILVEALTAVGVRADRATDFEDEELGVDAWAFLPIGGDGWRWYPVNCSTGKETHMDRSRMGSKYDRCLQKGVLPVRIPPKDFLNSEVFLGEKIVTELEIERIRFEGRGKTPLDRSEAVRQELKQYPKSTLADVMPTSLGTR